MTNETRYTFTHDGKCFVNWFETDALAAEVPQAVVDAAKSDAALARLATRRWRAECAGTTWEEHPVAASRDAQAQLHNAALAAQAPGFTSIAWKFADGVFRTLDAADVAAVKAAVDAHVAACFANEQALQAAVRADPEGADIDTGWPV